MASRYGLVAVCGITRGARFLVSMRVRSGERNKVFQAYCVKLYHSGGKMLSAEGRDF
jgi:hypothetical protein